MTEQAKAVIPYLRKTQFYETDMIGIIHHARYVYWMEEARTDYLQQLGYSYDLATESGVHFVLLSISCEYKSMVRFGDTVRIHMRLTSFHPAMLTVRYEMVDAETGELRCTAESKHCCYHSERKRMVSLAKELPELYEALNVRFLADKEEARQAE